MKLGWMLALAMVPYGALVPQSPGNPNGDGYVGKSDSVYDSAANPAKTMGTVAYDPMAPLAAPTNTPASTPINPPTQPR